MSAMTNRKNEKKGLSLKARGSIFMPDVVVNFPVGPTLGHSFFLEYPPARETGGITSEAKMSSMPFQNDVFEVVDRSACLQELRPYLGTDDHNDRTNADADLVSVVPPKKGGFCTHTRTIPLSCYHTHTHHGTMYMLSEVLDGPRIPRQTRQVALERDKTPTAALSHPPSFFTPQRHSRIRRLNHAENTPTCRTVEGRGSQALAHLRRDEPYLYPRSLRQQALRPGVADHAIAPNRAAFRCFSGSVALNVAEKPGRRAKKLAQALGTVLISVWFWRYCGGAIFCPQVVDGFLISEVI